MALFSQFSWDEPLLDEDGMVLSDRRFGRWLDGATRRFRASAEGRDAPDSGWLKSFFRLAVQYEGYAPSQIRPDPLLAVIFDVLPRKVVMEPSDGALLVRELQAFYAFASREYGSESAAACAARLTPTVGAALQRSLADPSKFGFAKALFGGGGEEPAQSPGHRLFEEQRALDVLGLSSGGPRAAGAAERSRKKRKRKQANKSRRKNR